METKSPTIHFACEAHRKSYESGLAIVKAKLAGHHKPTVEEIHQRSMLQGRVEVAVVKQLAALVKAGIPPAPARTSSTSTRTAPAPAAATRPAVPVAPTRGKCYHRYATAGLFA